jgi:hypothetical protein
MLRHGWPADGQTTSQLSNGHRPASESFEDRSPGAVGESRPRVGGFIGNHNR